MHMSVCVHTRVFVKVLMYSIFPRCRLLVAISHPARAPGAGHSLTNHLQPQKLPRAHQMVAPLRPTAGRTEEQAHGQPIIGQA